MQVLPESLRSSLPDTDDESRDDPGGLAIPQPLGDSRRRRRIGRGEPPGEATIGLAKLTSTTMFCPSFQTILNYPIQKTKTRQRLPGGGGKATPMQMWLTGVAGLSWRTDSFAESFPSTIKPSTANYNLMREDYEHFLKFGTSWHGELFCGGVRVPRKDGIPHAVPLPVGTIPR